jgi:GNAT superfamily N-acetyltransferase
MTQTTFSVRPARTPEDYVPIAAVLQADSPGWGATAEELVFEDARRDPQYHWATFVAEVGDGTEPLLVGVAFVGQEALAHREGRFKVDLRVHPDWQGQGAGKALYQAVLAHLEPLAPQELWTFVWHALPRPQRFLKERGFVESWQRLDSILDVAGFDFGPYAGLEEKLQEEGIQIKTYADLADDPERLTKLYELDWALWQDIPYGQSVTKRSLAQFAAEEIDHPECLPEACFIALHGDEFIGYSNLTQSEEGFGVGTTGVVRPYRGRGVATLLKLYGIRYAQAHGNRRLWVTNDSVNVAMLALNEKLGFVRAGAMLRFVKEIGKPQPSQIICGGRVL